MNRPRSANGAARDEKSKPKEAEKRRREPSPAKFYDALNEDSDKRPQRGLVCRMDVKE